MRSWRTAWAEALYGPDGFSVRGGRGPRHDFATSVTRGPALAQALAALVGRLRLPAGYDVVDVGAGDGRLVTDLRAALDPELADRGRFVAVELAPRPAGLPPEIEWRTEAPQQVRGLLIAHELLDTVPCEIVEADPDGIIRRVCVDGSGKESLGRALDAPDAAWLASWWPLHRPGQRADVGRSRDEAWRQLSSRVLEGVAIAVDYGHVAETRPAGSTLSGWSRGRRVPPIPDGSCDITAHVAFDSCRQPGDLLMTQRAALRSLARVAESGGTTPSEQLLALAETTRTRTLSEPDGLGGYLWLARATPGIDLAGLFAPARETGP